MCKRCSDVTQRLEGAGGGGGWTAVTLDRNSRGARLGGFRLQGSSSAGCAPAVDAGRAIRQALGHINLAGARRAVSKHWVMTHAHEPHPNILCHQPLSLPCTHTHTTRHPL